MYSRFTAFFFATAILAGCANVQPVLSVDAALDPAAGYVSGQFSRMKTRGFAFVIKAVDGGAEFVMPLGEDSSVPTAVKLQTVAIKLPPGRYTVSQWITYATLTKEVMSRKAVSGTALDTPFEIRPGSVLHLGSYEVSTENQSSYPRVVHYLQILPLPATEAQVQNAFALAYPKLANQSFKCLMCVDTVGGKR